MSMKQYSIMGYGIDIGKLSDCINEDTLTDKYDDIDELFYDIELYGLAFASSNDGMTYLYFENSLPWHLSIEEKSYTIEDIGKLIYKVLKPYLFNDVTKEQVIKICDYIDDSCCA